MSKVLTLDTSVLISLCSPDEQFYDVSRAFFENCLKHDYDFVMPELIYFETVNNLCKKFLLSSNKQKELRSFLSSPGFEWFSLTGEFRDYFDHHISRVSLKTADAIICLSCKMQHSTLVSWDKKLLNEAKRLKISSQTPG